MGPAGVGAGDEAAGLALEAADVHCHEVGIVLFFEVLVGQLCRAGQLVTARTVLLINDAVLGVEGLLILSDTCFQTGGLNFWLATINVRLVADILPHDLLLLLMDDRHRLSVHVMGLLLIVWLY